MWTGFRWLRLGTNETLQWSFRNSLTVWVTISFSRRICYYSSEWMLFTADRSLATHAGRRLIEEIYLIISAIRQIYWTKYTCQFILLYIHECSGRRLIIYQFRAPTFCFLAVKSLSSLMCPAQRQVISEVDTAMYSIHIISLILCILSVA